MVMVLLMITIAMKLHFIGFTGKIVKKEAKKQEERGNRNLIFFSNFSLIRIQLHFAFKVHQPGY